MHNIAFWGKMETYNDINLYTGFGMIDMVHRKIVME